MLICVSVVNLRNAEILGFFCEGISFKKLKWIFKLEVIGLQEMRCKEKKKEKKNKDGQ